MTKRVLAFLMVIAMVISLLPTVVVAETTTPGYTVTLQKAHNQTENSLAVDIYLQANTADQGDVAGYQFTVTPAEGLTMELPVAATGNNGVSFNGETNILAYDLTTAPAIPVGTARVHVATLTVSGTELPAVAEAITLSGITVTMAGGFYSDDANDAATEGYLGAVTQSVVADACADHACGHGEGTWTAFTAKSGKYLFNLKADAAATLNICDCTATGEGKDYTAGRLLPKRNFGGAITADIGAKSVINVYGGVIDGSLHEAATAEGPAVFINATNTFHMLGGKVENFTGKQTSDGCQFGVFMFRGTQAGECNAVIDGVTFVNCGTGVLTAPYGSSGATGAMNDSVNLTVRDVTVTGSKAGTHAIDINDVYGGKFKSVTVEGNCDFDAPVYLAEGESVTLNLGDKADVNILTEKDLDAEAFNSCVKMAQGGSLTAGTLLYENAGVFVDYADGKFTFAEGHFHDGVFFKAWDKTDSLPTSGNYYLENDVTLNVNAQYGAPADEAVVTVGANKVLQLDLRGHTITQKGNVRIFNIKNGGTLSIYDCAEPYDADGNWTGGKLTGSKSDFGAINVRTGGAFNMYGGQLTNNGTNGASHNGGAVYLYNSQSNRNYNGAVFNMYGGEISGNVAGYYGAAISTKEVATVPEGKDPCRINLIGGKICNNTALSADSSAGYGTIRAEGTVEINLSGTEITDNHAKNGGAFYLAGNSVLNISGGKVCDNSSTGNGGAIYCGNTADIYITGGEFNGNTGASGGMLAFDGTNTIEISNVTIENNQASSGGAISCGGTSSLTLTNCVLTGNIAKSSVGSAIYHQGTTTLKLVDTVITGNHCNSSDSTWKVGTIYTNTSTGKIILSGRTVITGNIGGAYALAQNIVFQGNLAAPKVYVNELTEGAHIDIYNLSKDGLTADALVKVDGSQTGWSCGYITYYETTNSGNHTYNAVAGKNVSRVDGAFTFGHYHTDAEGNTYALTAWESTTSLPQTTAATDDLHYYLTGDVTLAGDSYKLNVAAGTLELCTNGFDITASATGYKAFRNDGGTLTVTNCTAGYDREGHLVNASVVSNFKGNGNGATFCAIGSNVTTSTFHGLEFKNCYDWQRTSSLGFGGAAICVRDGNSLYVDGCNFTGNHTLGGGGAIQLKPDGSKTTNMEITNCVFDGNYAQHNGGAISVKGNSSSADVVLIENCKFLNNYTTTYVAADATAASSDSARGGAIYIYQAHANIKNCDFEGNRAIHAEGVTQSTSNTCQGGAIYNHYSAKVTIDADCTFTGNHSDRLGGAVFGYATVIAGGTYTDNTAGEKGGAICMSDGAATVNAGTRFEGNSAANGGAIYHTKDLTVSGATFKGNEVTGYGGAVMTDLAASATVTIQSGCVFEDNYAGTGGGAYDNENGSSYTLTLKVTDATFKNNAVPTTKWAIAGAMRIADTTNATLKNVTFDGNEGQLGGAIYTSDHGVSVDADNCTFTNNYAKNGGAVNHDWGTTLTYDGCVFENNSATENGGAIVSKGNSAYRLKIGETTACSFTGNSAKKGGALYVYNSGSYSPVSAVNNTAFTGNEAADGGAIHITSADTAYPVLTVSGCTMEENTASSAGAAISINGSSQVTMRDTTVQNNTDKGYFSAVFVQTASCKLTLSGKMIIADNRGNTYPNADLHFRDTSAVENNPTVTFDGLTAGSKIGLSATNGRYRALPVVGTVILAEGDTYENVAGYFFSDNEDRFITHVTDTGDVKLVNYVDGEGNTYQYLQEVVDAAAEGSKITLQAGGKIFSSTDITAISLNKDLIIDLNGKNVDKIVVAEGKTLKLTDSKTDDYNVANGVYGKTIVEGAYESYFVDTANNNKRYVVIANEDGTVSAHRVYLAINNKLLRTANRGVGFKAIYATNQVAAEGIEYGIELSRDKNFTEGYVLSGDFTEKGFTAGVTDSTPNQRTAVITDVLVKGNTENQANAEATIYGRPYMIVNGVKVTGNVVATSLLELAQYALESGNETVKATVNAWADTYGVDFS